MLTYKVYFVFKNFTKNTKFKRFETKVYYFGWNMCKAYVDITVLSVSYVPRSAFFLQFYARKNRY